MPCGGGSARISMAMGNASLWRTWRAKAFCSAVRFGIMCDVFIFVFLFFVSVFQCLVIVSVENFCKWFIWNGACFSCAETFQSARECSEQVEGDKSMRQVQDFF